MSGDVFVFFFKNRQSVKLLRWIWLFCIVAAVPVGISMFNQILFY